VQGLKTDAQGYIQRGLLQTSAEHSIAIGTFFSRLLGCGELDEAESRLIPAGACISDGWAKYCSAEQRFEVALAHIRGAFSDIKTYLDVSPPDSRYLPIMILRYLNLAPVLFGIDGLSPSLHELSAHSKRLKLTDRISDILYNGPVNTQQRLAWEIMQKHYEEAAKEWDPIFAGFDEVHESLKTGFTGLEKMMDELKCGGHSEPRSKGHYLVRSASFPERRRDCGLMHAVDRYPRSRTCQSADASAVWLPRLIFVHDTGSCARTVARRRRS
jgi:hypothetical protein